MEDMPSALAAIQERNRRVESHKAWEVSFTRRIFIAVTTFAAAFLFLWLSGAEQVLLPAAVPAAGYVLSTLSLPPLKRWWMRRYRSGMFNHGS